MKKKEFAIGMFLVNITAAVCLKVMKAVGDKMDRDAARKRSNYTRDSK